MALGGVLRDGYLIYAQLSADAAHPSLESLNRHITRLPNNEGIIDVVPASKDVEITQTRDWACNAMLGICVGVNQMLEGTPAGLRLWEIADRYETLKKALATSR